VAGLADRLAPLGERHARALSWFIANAGTSQPWPDPLDDGTYLATRAKGIYKPAWSKYAQSVRQILGGPYPDRDPEVHADGSWTYRYFQENADPEHRDREDTNAGLLACRDDGVPVGVMRQVSPRPNVRYKILGVTLVARWEDGYFVLEGLASDGGDGILREMQTWLAEDQGGFDPKGLLDARERTVAAIVRRRIALSD
jgi:hypothetical protein